MIKIVRHNRRAEKWLEKHIDDDGDAVYTVCSTDGHVSNNNNIQHGHYSGPNLADALTAYKNR